MWLKILIWMIFVEFLLAEPCEFEESVNITDGVEAEYGHILYDGVYYPPHLYANYNYTFNGTDEIPAEEHIRGCICLLKTCVFRCCPPGEYIHEIRCQEDTEVDHDFKVNGSNWKQKNFTNPQFHFIVNNLPDCDGEFIRLQPESSEDEKWIYFKNNGSILFRNNSQSLRYNEFCLANVIEDGVHFGTSALYCEKDVENHISVRDIYKVALFISIPFLLATIIIYSVIPELRNMFGKVLIGYVSSLVVAFIFLIVINEKFVVLGPFCTVSGFCLYFSLILCFSFLNVMGFDLWSNITGNRRNVQSKKKFLLYMAYAFGVPTLFLLLIVLLDKTGLYTTSIGTNSCFFWDKDTAGDIWVYFYIPILIALAANTFFFVKTADHIRQTKKEISARDNAKKDIHNYWMFVRLFLLMGLTWILEMLAQLTEWDIFHLTDILNCLQGVMIFFSFAYQGKTKKLVKEKFLLSFKSKESTIASHTSTTSI